MQRIQNAWRNGICLLLIGLAAYFGIGRNGSSTDANIPTFAVSGIAAPANTQAPPRKA